MSRTTLVLAIIVVVVIVVLLAWGLERQKDWASVGFWKMHFVESPEDVWRRSNGTLDAPARVALERSRALFNDRNPMVRVQNRHRAARILETNGGAHVRGDQETLGELEDIQRALLNDIQELHGVDLRFVDDAPDHVAIDHILDAVAAVPMNLDVADMVVQESTKTAEQRRKHIADAGVTGASAVREFVEASKTHTNDSQSSHDRSVNAQCKSIVIRLATLTNVDDITDDVEEIEKFFVDNADNITRDPRTGRPRANLVHDRALPVLRRISDNRSTIVSATGVSNHTLLCLVWARIHAPANNDRQKILQQSLFDSLLDCWSEGVARHHIVCNHGVMTRLVNCLTPLDADPSLYITANSESIRNEIFNSAPAVIEKTARDILSSSPNKFERAAAAEYIPGAGDGCEVPADAQDVVEEILRRALIAHVQNRVAKINAQSPGAVTESMEKKYQAEIVHAV